MSPNMGLPTITCCKSFVTARFCTTEWTITCMGAFMNLENEIKTEIQKKMDEKITAYDYKYI
jgi:hypothetical protein